MRRKAIIVLVIVFILAAGYGIFSRCVNIISFCIEDIDQKGLREMLLLTGQIGSEYGNKLVILSLSGEELIQKLPIESLKPWKIQTADVDGDNKRELSIGVYKTARFHNIEDKRPFLYNLYPEGLSPKWLGSRLSRPFTDYVFGDIDQDGSDELISIEPLSSGEKVIHAYRWKGFGFESAAESPAFQDISRIKTVSGHHGSGSEIQARVRMEQKWKRIVLVYEDCHIIVKE